ncbi:hypothetical protein [Actinacidiphila glaucinigra]
MTLPPDVAHLPVAQAPTTTAALPLLTRLLAPHPGPLVPEGTV